MAPSSPSPYLEASLERWADRTALARRDAEMLLDGLEVKGHFIENLRDRIGQHRREDATQLADARKESWEQWNVRLKRLEQWFVQATRLGQTSSRQFEWRRSADWFNRVRPVTETYRAGLEKKVVRLNVDLLATADKLQKWSDRLLLKESEIREFIARENAKGMELLLSAARKQPYLDFIYEEREEEGRLSVALKNIRTSANQALERLERADAWAAKKAEANPVYFEIIKSQLTETLRPVQVRMQKMREEALHQSLAFEEGRARLRWIYDAVRKIRVVQDFSSSPKPLLQRLFKTGND